MQKLVLTLAAVTLLSASAARAAELDGTWLRESGASQIRFTPCGAALCGSIVWIKPGTDTPAKVGQRIFSDMKPDGANAWSGTAFNPEDGKTYKGKMTLSGNTLTTAGCAAGGLFCRSTSWTKVK